jgi:hypothetical protein
MEKWTVDFKDDERTSVIVEADLLVTTECGAIEFHNEKKTGAVVVSRFEYADWKQVTKG